MEYFDVSLNFDDGSCDTLRLTFSYIEDGKQQTFSVKGLDIVDVTPSKFWVVIRDIPIGDESRYLLSWYEDMGYGFEDPNSDLTFSYLFAQTLCDTVYRRFVK